MLSEQPSAAIGPAELAPISRRAVSQRRKVMEEAGLILDERDGTHRNFRMAQMVCQRCGSTCTVCGIWRWTDSTDAWNSDQRKRDECDAECSVRSVDCPSGTDCRGMRRLCPRYRELVTGRSPPTPGRAGRNGLRAENGRPDRRLGYQWNWVAVGPRLGRRTTEPTGNYVGHHNGLVDRDRSG